MGSSTASVAGMTRIPLPLSSITSKSISRKRRIGSKASCLPRRALTPEHASSRSGRIVGDYYSTAYNLISISQSEKHDENENAPIPCGVKASDGGHERSRTSDSYSVKERKKTS